MAPKKRQKRDSFGASTMGLVPNFLLKTQEFIATLYSFRHCKPGSEQIWPFPFLHGGTFKEIAQRAWEQPDTLILDSITLLKKVKVIDSNMTVDEFGEHFLRMKAGSKFKGRAANNDHLFAICLNTKST